ncbi:MAG: transporter substrate-binding domain-containing protein, partial [Lautropia sp.]
MKYSSSQSSSLQCAQQRGYLIVGVKADMPPFGASDVNGEFQGFEIDLGRDIARKLELGFRPHAVVASNRIEAVREKEIDLLIASMVDLPQRREQVGVIDTPYYASPGIHVLARRDEGIRVMEDLRGRRVCGIEGSFYLDDISKRYSPQLVRFT